MQSRYSKKLAELENHARLLNGARFLRFVLFFYSFISFVFWFLNCLDVEWLYLFEPLFQIPYDLVSTFYKPEGVSADFSLAIIGVISLVLGFIFDFVVNNLYYSVLRQIEEEEIRLERQALYKKTRQKKQTRNRRSAAAASGSSSIAVQTSEASTISENSFEDAKLLFLIMPHLNKIKKKKEDLELTFQEVEIWKQRINKRLVENFSYSKPLQKGYYRKNLFLLYKDFNYIDEFVYYITPTIDSVILEFKKYGIKISFCYVFSAISQSSSLEKELDCMDTILALNFFDEFIVTNRFKVTYDFKPVHKYAMELKGEYNLSKNLSISNKQQLFRLEKEKTHDNENYKDEA